jgi:hypothetical protein
MDSRCQQIIHNDQIILYKTAGSSKIMFSVLLILVRGVNIVAGKVAYAIEFKIQYKKSCNKPLPYSFFV